MSPSTVSKPKLAGPAPTARRQFVIAQREPWRLPDDKIELPAPGASIGQPPSLNWITTLLPPGLMVCGTTVAAFFGTTGLLVALPMLLMSLGFPAASLISYGVQKRKHKAAVQARESAYRAKLVQEHTRIQGLIETQRGLLLREYPALDGLLHISLEDALRRERLWVRRPHDVDFLSLRAGLGAGRPSFSVSPPRVADQADPLIALANGVLTAAQVLPDLPILVPLASAGSLAVSGRSLAIAYGVTRRLLLDLLVHHSPQDLQLLVLADSDNAHERWDWLKWAPHSLALDSEEGQRRLAFTPSAADSLLEWLMDEFNRRRKKAGAGAGKAETQPAIVVLLDDSGRLRQSASVAQLASAGFEAGIHLLFAGAQNWPRECRARLDVGEETFRYVETWGGEGGGTTQEGRTEQAGMQECERITRALAALRVTGSRSAASLPDSIRISEVLGPGSLYLETLKQRWSKDLGPRDQLQFPVGVSISREEIEPVVIDLRPEGLGGKQAFHTVLIGTTGSGKSVFLQSLVLGAAYQYSPRHLNVLLMDFKAGASELAKLKELPHVVGLVTDLGPELAERALVAIDSEIQRRKRVFEEAGKISDIWAYNQRFPDQPLPHLLLVLDEFAKGVELLPDLQKVLQTLATQGRALGMYLLLANQKVTSAVDALLANIGWRIALRVAEREEMRIVDPTLAPTKRPGRGYLRVKEDVFEFQGARSDQSVSTSGEETDEFSIHQVGADGARSLLYKHAAARSVEDGAHAPALSEVETLIGLMKQAAGELGLSPARRIYLDPLPAVIPLGEALAEAGLQPLFQETAWSASPAGHLRAAIGFVDQPQDCLQAPLEVDFNAQDGHLWMIGAPGSGREMALASLLLSLAATHTPEELQFYVLEYGGGSLRAFDALPHTAAVLRLPEQERLERLLNFLEGELDRRTAASSEAADRLRSLPALFLVINNFAELRQSYPDHADRISRFVRDGRTAGIHLVIATSRGIELTRAVASNIARRLVLQLASRDEYMDVVGRSVPPLAEKADGRGYWVDSGVTECQVAQPALPTSPGAEALEVRELGKAMRAAWSGRLPEAISTLAGCIPLAEMLAQVKQPEDPQEGLLVPVGMSHESLQVIKVNLRDELPSWLVLGPRQSGKSNFLACAGASVLQSKQAGWQVSVIGLRRSPLVEWARQQAGLKLAERAEQVVSVCQELGAQLDSPPAEMRHLILIDDLGSAFEVGKEPAAAALNNLAVRCGACSNVYILAAGLLDELRAQMAAPLVRLLRQSRTGLGLTKDPTELDWLGYQPSLQVRKVELTAGRGFWVTRGKGHLVQTPLLGDCPQEKHR